MSSEEAVEALARRWRGVPESEVRRPWYRRWLSRWGARAASLMLGVVALWLVVVGWDQAHAVRYVAGLVLLAAAVLMAFSWRRWWAWVMAAGVGLVGVAGPWLGVQVAYREVGVPTGVGFPVVEASERADGALFVRTPANVWVAEPDGEVRYVLAHDEDVTGILPGGQLVRYHRSGTAVTGYSVFDEHGEQVWSSAWASGMHGSVIATAGQVLVEEQCVIEEDQHRCQWAGRQISDGEQQWTVHGAPALDDSARSRALHSWWLSQFSTYGMSFLGNGWLATSGAEGVVELRSAATGQVVHRVERAAPVFAFGDVALQADEGSCELVLVDLEGATTMIEPGCEVVVSVADRLRSPSVSGEPQLRLQWWGEEVVIYETPGRGWALDLETAEVREVDRWLTDSPLRVTDDAVQQAAALSNGTVQVEAGDGALVVRDVSTGEALWSYDLAVAEDARVWLGDQVVLVDRVAPSLLLHEWFAPHDPQARTLELLDARTGQRIERARYGVGAFNRSPESGYVASYAYQALLVGDRVLLGIYQDDQWLPGGRIIG